MPGLARLGTAKPHPFAGQNAAAFKKLFEVLGEGETMRRKKMLDADILGVLQRGGDPETIMKGIAGAVQAAQQPTYSPEFLPGLFQRIAAPFAEAPGAGITDALAAQAIKPQPRTEIQKLMAEGYTPEKAKMIRDISHGLEPRASSRLTYDNMTEVEKLDFLTKVKQRAEGQYYGVLKAEAEGQGRKVQPRAPKLLDWTLRELNKLPQYRQQGAVEAKTGTKRPGFLGRKATEFPAGFPATAKPLPTTAKPEAVEEPPEVPEEVVTKRKEVGLRPLELGPEEKAAYKKVLNIWGSLPANIRHKMMSLRAADFTWAEILTGKDLIPYLGE